LHLRLGHESQRHNLLSKSEQADHTERVPIVSSLAARRRRRLPGGIGLFLQSLHDGESWVHTSLRLSVLIEARRLAIERVLEKHGRVRELVDKEWLHPSSSTRPNAP